MEDDSFDPVQFHFLKMKKELHVVKSLFCNEIFRTWFNSTRLLTEMEFSTD